MSDYNISLQLRANSTNIIDLSNNNITNNNVVPVLNSPFGSNKYILSFNGTNSYLSIPVNDTFNFGNNDFTVCWWEYITNANYGNPILIYQSSISAEYGSYVFGWSQNSGRVVFMSSNNSSWDIANLAAYSSNIDLNKWNYCTITRHGNTFSLFKNGTLTSTFQSSSYLYKNSSFYITIGSHFGYYLNGYVDDLVVIKGRGLFTSNFSVPTTYLLDTHKYGVKDSYGNIWSDV